MSGQRNPMDYKQVSDLYRMPAKELMRFASDYAPMVMIFLNTNIDVSPCIESINEDWSTMWVDSGNQKKLCLIPNTPEAIDIWRKKVIGIASAFWNEEQIAAWFASINMYDLRLFFNLQTCHALELDADFMQKYPDGICSAGFEEYIERYNLFGKLGSNEVNFVRNTFLAMNGKPILKSWQQVADDREPVPATA